MITFGGEPLLVPDADGELAGWLDAYQDIRDSRIFVETPPGVRSSRHVLRQRFEQTKGIGLPVLNYPPPPLPRLNSLWMPTGATRWARGYFLATKEVKDRIVGQAHSGSANVAMDLKWGDDSPGAPATLETSLYLLPPFPVSGIDTSKFSGQDTLWILPLVDVRYWWQFASVDDLEVTTATTWTDLFDDLGTALGVDIDVGSAVASAYGSPDPNDFTRRYDNAAMLLDAAAWSVGKRLALVSDGTAYLDSPADAEEMLASNLAENWQIVAGGDRSDEQGDLPAKVLVAYRKIRQYLLRNNGQVYTVEKDAPSGTLATAEGKRLVIHSAAYADYNTSDVLQNSAFLDALAVKIRDDYFAWMAKRYDRTFIGAQFWELCGFDDAVTWDFGRPVDYDGQRLAQTRVVSLPANFVAETHLASDPTKEIVEPHQVGKATEEIAAGDTGECEIYDGDAGSESATGQLIQAFNRTDQITAEDTWVALTGMRDAQWYETPLTCEEPA